jgi:hypothetical protein
MKKQIILSLLILLSNVGFGQTPCENGKAGEFPCRRVDLYAHLDNSLLSGRSGIEGNDIWGWTDPMSGKEYAFPMNLRSLVDFHLIKILRAFGEMLKYTTTMHL